MSWSPEDRPSMLYMTFLWVCCLRNARSACTTIACTHHVLHFFCTPDQHMLLLFPWRRLKEIRRRSLLQSVSIRVKLTADGEDVSQVGDGGGCTAALQGVKIPLAVALARNSHHRRIFVAAVKCVG